MTEPNTEPMTEDGTLVVRVTMNPRLRRVAFASTIVHLVWCAVVIVPATILLISRPAPELVAIALILIACCGWAIRSDVVSARRKYRALSMGMPTLRLDDLGVQVRDLPWAIEGANVAWADCAAVVISKAPKRPGWPVQPVRYVQFVPLSEDRVETKGMKPSDVRADLLGLSRSAASLAWLELPGSSPDADHVVAWLRTHQPDKRIVGAGHSVTDE